MLTPKSLKKPFRKFNKFFFKDSSKRKLICKFDWREILKSYSLRWDQLCKSAKNGPKILIATSTGGHFASTCIESLLGIVMTLRSAKVNFILCDRFLPACLQAMSTSFTRDASAIEEYCRIFDQLPLGEKLADGKIL